MKAKKKSHKKSVWNSLKDFYKLYTAGLSRVEIERLLKRESLDVLSYYKRGAVLKNELEINENFPKKQLLAVKEIFLSFVLKLTPARRLFYGVAFILFMVALAFSNWLYAFLAFLVMNFLLAFELADKMLSKDELEIARDIQLDLQPEKDPEVAGLDITAFYRPAKEVGGDYYDFIKIDDHKIAIILGDVSGKGMPAALYAVKLQGLFELLAKHRTSPKEMLVGINEIISQRLKKQYFITAVVGVFDVKTRKLHLARAGHNPPIYFKSKTKETVWLKPGGLGIGLDQNSKFEQELVEKSISFSKGDLFLFYTDGIIEARNGAKIEFGEKRLVKIISESVDLDASGLKEKLVTNLDSFAQKALLDDDATFVVVKVGRNTLINAGKGKK